MNTLTGGQGGRFLANINVLQQRKNENSSKLLLADCLTQSSDICYINYTWNKLCDGSYRSSSTWYEGR